MSGVIVDPVFGCRLWQGKLDKDGYGYHGRSRAHIVAWESEFGPVPDGFELSHECIRRNCANVAHLRLVTRSENERMKSWRYRARIKQCRNGHDMKIQAMITPEGGRVCRVCTFGDGHAVR